MTHVVLGLTMGGTEGLVDQMLRRPPAGFRASAICLDEVGVFGEKAIRDGLPVTLIPRGDGLNWGVPLAIARYARRESVDILHCHHYTPWFYGALSRVVHRAVRVVFTEHGRLYPDIPSVKKRMFNRLMIPLTSAVTAVSPAVAEALVRVEGLRRQGVRVIFNGVDDVRFTGLPGSRELRRRLGLRPDFVYFVLCSRLDPIKWIGGLLEALRRVVEVQPNCGLLLVGDGSERRRIEETIERLLLKDHVLVAGYQTNTPEWLAAADVFVLSSLSEGTSVSLIESMATGIPSVVTRVGGNPHLVEDGVTGLVVEPEDVQRLAAGMLRLAQDSDLRLRLGGNARRRFTERFEITRMLAGYETIYRDIVAAGV